MIIVCQTRRKTINFERVIEFNLYKNKKEHNYVIECLLVNNNTTILGKYESEKQAEEVYMSLNNAISLQNHSVNINGSVQLQIPAYYMPLQRKEK